MQTYSVTGTYTYRDGEWTGTGQYPGATFEAVDAIEAAETYRADMLFDLVDARPLVVFTESNVCAVSLTGPPEVHSDPLEGVPA